MTIVNTTTCVISQAWFVHYRGLRAEAGSYGIKNDEDCLTPSYIQFKYGHIYKHLHALGLLYEMYLLVCVCVCVWGFMHMCVCVYMCLCVLYLLAEGTQT